MSEGKVVELFTEVRTLMTAVNASMSVVETKVVNIVELMQAEKSLKADDKSLEVPKKSPDFDQLFHANIPLEVDQDLRKLLNNDESPSAMLPPTPTPESSGAEKVFNFLIDF